MCVRFVPKNLPKKTLSLNFVGEKEIDLARRGSRALIACYLSEMEVKKHPPKR